MNILIYIYIYDPIHGVSPAAALGPETTPAWLSLRSCTVDLAAAIGESARPPVPRRTSGTLGGGDGVASSRELIELFQVRSEHPKSF